MDSIIISDLKTRCVLGVGSEERREKQDIVINITLCTDIARAAETDDLRYALDYRALKKKVLRLVENSRYRLVETLASAVAELCLKEARAEKVRVKVEKPTALRFAGNVGVEIVRAKEGRL